MRFGGCIVCACFVTETKLSREQSASTEIVLIHCIAVLLVSCHL